ncbi:MAG TPA: universal stress protein [Acidimicrobiales bacterium]|nr:universal stress protein [Acidimicrobiales bacterium]
MKPGAPHDEQQSPAVGAARGPLRLLLCVDEKSTIADLVAYAARAAIERQAEVRVVHVVDYAFPTGLTGETVRHARSLLDETVFELQMAGLGGEAVLRQCSRKQTAAALVAEARTFDADRIILGARRKRLLGCRVRERVLRRAGPKAVVAPHVAQKEGNPVEPGCRHVLRKMFRRSL